LNSKKKIVKKLMKWNGQEPLDVWHERDLVKPAADSPFAQYRVAAKDGVIRVYADQQGTRARFCVWRWQSRRRTQARLQLLTHALLFLDGRTALDANKPLVDVHSIADYERDYNRSVIARLSLSLYTYIG
jgi:hypothetical protein